MSQSGISAELYSVTCSDEATNTRTPDRSHATSFSRHLNLKSHCPCDSSCYRLSKRPNCFRGTCSGLGTWRPRCIKGASSGTRHVVPLPFLSPIALVTVPLSGAVTPMTPALSMTHASAPVPVPFPQLSPHVPSYRPITPNPCALGQQVIASLSRLIVLSRLVYSYPDHS